MYQPVVSTSLGSFTARALVGSRSIMLAWNHIGPEAERADLLGFAIHRFDLTANDDDWLKGQKRFPGQENMGPDVPSDIAPFQRFRWGDYGAYPEHQYRYEIHPVRLTAQGKAKLDPPMQLDLQAAPSLADGIGVYSNRGVTASLAYNTRFKQPPQDLPEPKQTEAYTWLTRDLKPELSKFIKAAVAGDELRVAIYEFEDDDIAADLLDRIAHGVTVRIVYHARVDTSQTAENEAHLAPLVAAGAEVVGRSNTEKLSHNKFVVHLKPAGGAGGTPTPVRVWTGSTNMTRAGFYLQTNLGLVFESAAIADGFAKYWEILRSNPLTGPARAASEWLLTTVRGGLPNGPLVFFSPVTGRELLTTAITLVAGADDLVLISAPFGLDVRIRDAINANSQDVIEFGLVNKTSQAIVKQLPHAQSRFSLFTPPAWVPTLDGKPWDNKPFGQHKVHTKAIVTDPFGAQPKVLVGSSNFSDESVNWNDENAFLIVGERRVAAIIATEFLRMFDHYKTRSFIAGLEANPDDGFLASEPSWSIPYYEPFRRKCQERKVFAGEA